METEVSLKPNKIVSKDVVLLSIVTISLICAALFSYFGIAHAATLGWAEWYNPNTSSWELIPPSPDHLNLLPEDLPIQMRIGGLSSFIGKTIQIKVENEEWFVSTDRVQLITADYSDPFWWPDPDYPYDYDICEPYLVQFREVTDCGYYAGEVHYASGTICGEKIPAYIHIIPEFAFGTVMAILSSLTGLAAYTKYRRK